VWGRSGEQNGKWVGYDAECPPQMNGGSGQFAAAHVLIKIGNKQLPGEWVIPLSHLANTYANAGIWKTGFQPTLGYTGTWHRLRVGISVTAIKTTSTIKTTSRQRRNNVAFTRKQRRRFQV